MREVFFGLLNSQLDYVLFLSGFASIVMGVSALALRKGRINLGWIWFAMFAFMQGIARWMEMYELSLPDWGILSALRTSIFFASFLCLSEFGRSGILILLGKGAGQWSHLPMILLSGLGGLAGMGGLETASRYCFALFGGMVAALVFYFAARGREGSLRVNLLVMSVVMGLHALASGLIVPAASFFPATVLNQDTFQSVMGFPVQELRALLTIFASVALLGIAMRTEGSWLYGPLVFHRKVRRILAGVLSLLLAGWILTEFVGRCESDSMRSELSARAVSISTAISPREVAALKGNDSDLGTETYERLRRQFRTVRISNPGCRFVYLAGLRDGKVFFYLDSEPAGSKSYSPPGQIYTEAPEKFVRSFKTGFATVEGPLEDRWGRWYSGLCPIRESNTGKVLALFGMDIEESLWLREIGQIRLISISVLIGLLIFLFSMVAVFSTSSRTDERLRVNEHRYRSLVEGSPNPVCLLDHEGFFVTVNPAGLSELGWSEEETASRNFKDIWPNSVRSSAQRAMQDALEGRRSGFDGEYVRQDGRAISWQVTTSPICDSDGIVTSFVAICNDITEQKRITKAMQISEQKYRSLIQNMPIGVYRRNLEPGIVTMANPAFARMLGYASAEEAVGMDILDAYVQESQMLSFKSRLTRQEKIVDEELQLRRRDGSTIWVSATAQLVRDENGRHAFVDGLLEDITQRKQIETEIRQAKERAEAANTAKSEFLARMSHEIRTPMNGVLGMLDLVIDSRMDSEQREYLTLARESAETLLEIVNDILDFSKIEAGKMQTENIEFGLRDCVEDTLAPLGLRAGARKLELLCDIDSRVPDSLVGDPKHLRQVLTNLVGNALKFTEKGEIVVVIDSRTLEGDLNELHVYVTDTGVGIDPVSQDRIFDAFEQAGGAKGKFGGTGLGLAITRQLVQLMGGTIRVQSELGKGSTFHFTAKFRTGHKPGRSGPIHTGMSLRGLPVLIVDDNFTNRRILTDVLLNWQMKPTAVDSAAAAMEVMNKAADAGQPYPLILLDACMPDTDGFALAGQITAESRFAGVKMIMLTSAGHLGDEEHCRKNGISGYLLKPIRQSVLLDLIMTTLGVETREEPKAASAPSTLVESGKSLPPLRILLAEDNPVNQRLAVKLLEKWRHSVSAVSDGLQVLSSLETQTYDVILMDVQMPGMDGIEATGAIRRKEASAGGHIPIIAMTAHALKGDRERCVKAGMDDYVSKPINPKELASAIERAIATAEAIRTENSSVPEMAAK